jgi:hypothetical protein
MNRIASFDVFDTLIARRCITPEGVFARVERTHPMVGFAALRRLAEHSLAGQPYRITDIYARLAALAGLSAAQADALLASEIAAERAELIPIAENLQQVCDGDVLVSDMYHDPATILLLLREAGLRREIGLVVTPHGKASGTVWPLLLEAAAIARHLGDNPHSDVEMPRRFGIAAEHTDLSRPTGIESWLIDAGLGEIALVLREARLRSCASDPVARRLQLIQIQINAPLLLLASIALQRLGHQLGAERLLFASRDGNLWLTMFDALSASFPDHIDAEYFYTSRRARIDPSPAYRAYAAERLGATGLLVDLCGTGWSGALLLQALGLRDRHAFLIHQLPPAPLYENRESTPDTCTIHALVPPPRADLDHIRLEMANYAAHGSIIGVQQIAGGWLPLLDSESRSEAELGLVSLQRAAFAQVADIVARTRLHATIALDETSLAGLVGAFYTLLSREKLLSDLFGASHHGEDMRTLRSLALVA